MPYPLISEYIEAIKSSEDNFDELKNLRPVLDEDGAPVMSGGNFAVVFKMKNEQTGKLYAVKCFLKEQEHRAESYRLIDEELEYVSSTFLTPIRYLDKELFVDSNASEDTEFPVLLMDWVEGVTLDNYIRDHIGNQYELSMLAYQFSRLAMWLMPQPFAHGDLKPDNILVRTDGTLVLVDYDGMYVPAMKGQKARELGSPDFRHPSRTEDDFDEHIDDFSLASILLSLKAIALQPSLLEEYGATDRLLFSENDYRNLSECEVLDALKPLMQDKELITMLSTFLLAASHGNLSHVSFRFFNLARPDRSMFPEEELSTEVTEDDLANAWTDEYGVKYSIDKKRLLHARDISNYAILTGTTIICNRAVAECSFLQSITIPDSVVSIGEYAFSRCSSMQSITIPDSVTSIGNHAFSDCSSLRSITIPDSVTNIGEYAFSRCSSMQSITIPDSVTSIGYSALSDCSSLKSITIPDSVISIGDGAFFGCSSLKYIMIPDSVTNIRYCAFFGCSSLRSITIPDSVTSIGENAFCECFSLQSIKVDVKNSYYDSRDNCNSIIDSRTNTLIAGCSKSVIPDSVTSIGNWAFRGHSSLQSIAIPDSVTSIGNMAFYGCSSLRSITIPESVTSIGYEAFHRCFSLQSITIPDGVTSIGVSAFEYCSSLHSIIIPKGTRTHFESLLPDFTDILIER